MTEVETIRCYTCKVHKPVSQFYKGAGAYKPCYAATRKKKYHENIEESRRKNTERRHKNLEQSRKHARDSYARHREERQAKYKAWRKSEGGREVKNLNTSTRYHTMRSTSQEGEVIALDGVFKLDEGICQLCKKPCDRKDASIDHILPLSREGTHTWDNVQLAHKTCNTSKRNLTMEEWLARREVGDGYEQD